MRNARRATNSLTFLTNNELEVRMADEQHIKYIPLTQGKFAIVDTEDFDWLMERKWHVQTNKWNSYAMACIKGSKVKIPMHRLVLQATGEYVVDHINGNGLDNRRCNLRLATASTNAQNSRKQKGSKSKYKGIAWDTRGNCWIGQIRVNQKTILLGNFRNEIEGAYNYDIAGTKYYGEFARTNVSLGLLPENLEIEDTRRRMVSKEIRKAEILKHTIIPIAASALGKLVGINELCYTYKMCRELQKEGKLIAIKLPHKAGAFFQNTQPPKESAVVADNNQTKDKGASE